MSTATATFTLWLLMDPVGNLPVFSAVLRGVPTDRRRAVLVRELLFALGFLILFLLAGRFLFGALHLHENSVRIAGGLILATIAFRMLFPGQDGVFGDTEGVEPMFFPLAVPMVAGPATMSLLLLLSSNDPGRTWDWFLALFGAWGGVCMVLALATPIARVAGEHGLDVLQRLMGMLLTCMAVQMLVEGISASLGAR